MADVLVDAGYEFRTSSGEAYLAALAEGGEVDLLLLDLKLPGIGGMDVLDVMSAGPRGPHHHDHGLRTFETAVKATKLGAYDFLAKPFTPDELRYALRKATSQLILSSRRASSPRRSARSASTSSRCWRTSSRRRSTPSRATSTSCARRGRPEPADGRAQHRARGRHEEAHHRPARPDAHRVGPARARHQAPGPARAGHGVDGAVRRRRRAPRHHRDARGGDDIELLADPGEIEIVLNNLISNAVKYNRDGGDVTCQAQPQGRRVTITVTDTGIGLDARRGRQALQRVHAHQERADRQDPRQRPGPSTVRKIANMYDGEATVNSEPGEGSTFTVTLHDARPAGAGAAAGRPRHPAVRGGPAA